MGLANDGNCKFFHNEEKNVIHVLRDCRMAKCVWIQIGILEIDKDFFRKDESSWLSTNFKSKSKMWLNKDLGSTGWNIFFSMGC